jgi:hypothetical protein
MLAAAARAERDHRLQSYSARIRGGSPEAEGASIDYQCWVAIAEWLETDRFFSFAGGADPERADAPIIRWPELEAAAEAALIGASAKCDRMLSGGDGEGESYVEACVRRARLACIHRKVQLRRQMIDSLNRDLRRAATGKEIAA